MAYKNNTNNKLKRNGERPETSEKMALFLKRKLTPLFEEFEVDFSYLGGSWTQDVNNWWSDIDIFISLPDFYQLNSKIKLQLLTKLCKKATDLTKYDEIQISVLETLPLHVQFSIISYGVLLYENIPDIHSNFIEKLLPLYYDHMVWYNRLINQSEYL